MTKLVKLNMITGQTSVDDLEVVTETSSTVYVNIEEIREFYPRRDGRVGTRISFKNSAGIAVKESVEEVAAAINGMFN